MSTNYDYQTFIDLCDKMDSGIHEVPAPEIDMSFEDWNLATRKAINSVKQRLYEFNEDKQRHFFIHDIFDNIFNPINNIFYFQCFSYADNEVEIKKHADQIIAERAKIPDFDNEPECYVLPWDRYFLHSNSQWYISRCTVSVFTFTTEISELCFKYGIKFEHIVDEVMVNHHETVVDIRSCFFYKISTGAYMNRGVLENYELAEIVKEPAKIVKLIPDTFELMLKEEYRIHSQKFIQLLRDVKQPLISEGGEWIGNKGASRIYFSCLLEKSIINPISITQAAKIFEGRFPGIADSFNKLPQSKSRAWDYKDQINEEIDKILTDIKLEAN